MTAAVSAAVFTPGSSERTKFEEDLAVELASSLGVSVNEVVITDVTLDETSATRRALRTGNNSITQSTRAVQIEFKLNSPKAQTLVAKLNSDLSDVRAALCLCAHAGGMSVN